MSNKPTKVIAFTAKNSNFSNAELEMIDGVTAALSVILDEPVDLNFWKPTSVKNIADYGSVFMYGTYRNSISRKVIPFLNRDGKPTTNGVISLNTVIKHIADGKII